MLMFLFGGWKNRKMLKQCKEKDQQNKAVSEIDDVSCLPLSMVRTKIPVILHVTDMFLS